MEDKGIRRITAAMARDFLKDDLYFEKFLQDETARIEKYSKGIEMVIQQRGEHDDGVRVGYIILTGYHFAKLRVLYSAGHSINEIRDFFLDVIEVLEKSWSHAIGKITERNLDTRGYTIKK